MAISSWQQTRERWTDSYQPMPDPTHLYMCAVLKVNSAELHRYIGTYMPTFNLRVWVKVQILNRFLAFMLYAVHLRNSEVYYTRGLLSLLLLVNTYVLYAKEF